MVTAIPPLSDSEKIEFGENSNHQPHDANKLVVASYNIRYGAFLSHQLFGNDHCFDFELRALRFLTQSQSFDVDQIVDLSVSNGARLPKQGIVTAGDMHQSTTSAQMGQ